MAWAASTGFATESAATAASVVKMEIFMVVLEVGGARRERAGP
jgi:hypothetical protein